MPAGNINHFLCWQIMTSFNEDTKLKKKNKNLNGHFWLMSIMNIKFF